ncbi:MAG: leucine-rich repeat domain-containing protein [Clostridia bacterium]|nr:leucine-rich repeat domain-containing protein [Clostridia bacterium]
MSVPYLAFYGDWTVAPLFDIDYYATNKDELDDSIDLLDKTLPDAYATRPIGGLYDDYVNYLGSYYFQQSPTAVKIAADRKYISLSNQEESINSLRFVWAGLLRNASRIEVTITEDATGEVVFETVDKDIRKSYGEGGPIAPANVDVEFSAVEQNLKNNTAYTVKLKGYLDYGDGGGETNLSNTFEFPLVTDFLAPAITGCEFYTEYDKTEEITRYYAKIAVYDNHYSMGMQVGYLNANQTEYFLDPFDAYVTPIYSEFNSTTNVVYELTDYIQDLREGIKPNSFMVICYDYAMNQATYEIDLPDEFVDVWLEEEEIVLSPNQIYTLNLNAYPYTEWGILAEEIFSSNTSAARIVNDKIVAVAPGESTVSVRFNDSIIKVKVRVLGEEDEGYVRYDQPVADDFRLSGYYVDKAFYFLNSDEREIGSTEDERVFSGNNYNLSMYPSEAVTLRYKLDAYFPDATSVVFESSNDKLVKVDQNGKITAVAEGFASVSVKVLMNGKSTYYSETINIEIKDPFITTGASLTHYFGNGGYVSFPPTLAITEIGQFAFSNFDYVLKGPEDEISDEVPELSKIWYIGDNTIEEVVIPEGVETIGAYAFANLTALKKVVLPSTLERIDYGAFYGCTALQTVVGLENVKFINQGAFAYCALKGTINLDNAIAIANDAFAGNKRIKEVVFTKQIQSIGSNAFLDNTALERILERADGKTDKIVLSAKLGQNVFMNCSALTEISINSAVIPSGTFDGCKELEKVTLGANVAVVGEYAFRGTAVASFTVENGNSVFYPQAGKPYLLNADGTEILLIAPATEGELIIDDDRIVSIASNASAGNKKLTSVIAPSVKKVGNYAFADCTRLKTVQLGTLTEIGDYAFYNTLITAHPSFAALQKIGAYSFACTNITSVSIPDGFEIGKGAFQECKAIASVTVGDNVIIGADAFRLDREFNFTEGHSYTLENGQKIFYYEYTSPLTSLTIGENVTIGDAAFMGAAVIEHIELGGGAKIGKEAFYNTCSLKSIDLSKVVSIGDLAFSGDIIYDFSDGNYSVPAMNADGEYIYRYFTNELTEVDLSSLTFIGKSAFAYCLELSTVVLGENLTEIADFGFDGCVELSAIDLSNIVKIGSNAFTGTKLQSLTLTDIESVGSYAFANIPTLTSVAFGNQQINVGEGAFASCTQLNNVSNMKNVVYVGDYAFAQTAIVSADLSAATYIGEQAFLKDQYTDFAVVIGECLENIGDNPFAMCHLIPFSSTITESANGKDYVTEIFTFDINEKIRVINGSLYRVVPKGLELIAYAGSDTDVIVADDTVRIAAMAFAGTDVSKVVLPYTVASIGHKAFFACKDLKLVAFNSYKAPILEEEYDITYFITGQNLPATGEYEFVGNDDEILIYDGLGIVPYFMWNVSSLPSNTYYGANFVDYIGHGNGDLVMVCPVNGMYYDSFVLTRYFGLQIDGAAAADEITLAAILAINNLPEKITLADKALVEFARAAYDRISTHEQQALVTNYDKLVQAEKRIRDLEYLENQDKDPDGTDAPDTETAAGLPLEVILCIVFGAATAILLSLSVVLLVLLKKSKKTSVTTAEEADETEAPALEDASDGDVSEDISGENGTEDADPEQRTENEKSEADESSSDEEKND